MQGEPETIWFLALLYSQRFKEELWGYKRTREGFEGRIGFLQGREPRWGGKSGNVEKKKKGRARKWSGRPGAKDGSPGSVPCHQLHCPTRFTSQSWPVPQPLTSLATSQRAGNQGFHCRASAQDKPWTHTAWWRCLDTQPLAHSASFQPLR